MFAIFCSDVGLECGEHENCAFLVFRKAHEHFHSWVEKIVWLWLDESPDEVVEVIEVVEDISTSDLSVRK